jgi:fatty-acyl-CoA synthase
MGRPVGDSVVALLDADGVQTVAARFGAGGTLTNAHEAIGEMVVRGGAARFEGYYNNPDATRERVRGEDFWTGDLAYRDAAGFLFFSGRTSDWIRVDGENIAVAPIEKLLERYEDVSQAVVYGVPDERTSDQVMAALSLAPGADFDAEAFAAFLTGQSGLGTKWRPRLIRCSRGLPTTANGKVSRPTLREQAWGTDDPQWIWSSADRRYVPFTEDTRTELVAAFREHGREHLLPNGIMPFTPNDAAERTR